MSVKELIEKDHDEQKSLCNQPRHIFTDLELDYYIGLITKHVASEVNAEESAKEEFKNHVILTYFNRSLYTLRELTRLLKIDFHYDRMFKKYEHSYTVDTVLTLMTRCRKMYHGIDMMQTIFKLLIKLKELQEDIDGPNSATGLSAASPKRRFNSPGKLRKETLLKDRIRSVIKSFLAQHTLFPI